MDKVELPPALAEAASSFGRYLTGERARSAHTVRAYLSDLGSLLEHAAAEGARELAEIELGTLRRWLGAQSEAGISRSTLARRSATARTFTAWALREELIETDPALRLKAPKVEGSLPGVLQQQQLVRLLTELNEAAQDGSPMALRDRAMVELLYATGLRVGELAGLDIDDLDPDRRTLRVLGKGNKERTVPYGLPAALAVDDWLRRGRPSSWPQAAGLRCSWACGAAAWTSARCGASSRASLKRWGTPPPPAPMRCATRRPHTCSTEGPTFGRYRKSWGTAAWPPPRSTPTSRSTASGKSYQQAHPRA